MKHETLLQLDNIHKHYKNFQALNGVSVSLESGQMMALLGHNGAGKTTLMKIILGMLKADKGDLSVLGHKPGERNRAIGYVPENVNFYPTLTGEETLLYFARLNGLSKKDAKSICALLLKQVHLDDAKHRAVKQYSKGMKQRLGLAQALLPSTEDGVTYENPKLLILDEPTVGLDPIATAEFYELLANLQLQGCGVIICTHVLPGLEPYIDTALILDHGLVVARGSLEELQQAANLPITLTASAVSGEIDFDAPLKVYQRSTNTLEVPVSEKVSVLKHLLKHDNVADVNIHAPMLPEVYQHFATRSNQGGSHAE